MRSQLLSTLLLLSVRFGLSMPGLTSDSSTASDSTTAASCNLAELKKLAFDNTLTQWTNTFHSNSRPTCFQWCADACSWSPDSDPISGTNWKPACARHDFSWRNLKRLKQFTEDNKLIADEHLRDGMIELCGSHAQCVWDVNNVYYPAVRQANKPASDHNVWNKAEGSENTDCTVFPGCCADHGSSQKCGPQKGPGQYKGDKTCVAK
jgi:Prokaryotic phospholipase A2